MMNSLATATNAARRDNTIIEESQATAEHPSLASSSRQKNDKPAQEKTGTAGNVVMHSPIRSKGRLFLSLSLHTLKDTQQSRMCRRTPPHRGHDTRAYKQPIRTGSCRRIVELERRTLLAYSSPYTMLGHPYTDTCMCVSGCRLSIEHTQRDLWILSRHVYIYIHTYMCIEGYIVYIYIYIYIYTYAYISIYVYICTYIYNIDYLRILCIYININIICIHTFIYRYI
jgi:hypothetical protein